MGRTTALSWTAALIAAAGIAAVSLARPPADLLFNSGFEADSVMVGISDIAGVDRSVAAPNNWDTDSWDYDFNYVGGTPSQRRAEIVDDPTGKINPKTGKVNRALHFWLLEAPMGTRARTRVAAQIHQLDRTEWFNRRRIFVHPDMALLSDFPGDSRVMFEEIKVIETTKDPHFRITLVWSNLGKSSFAWAVEAEDFRNQRFWLYQSKAPLPIGEWFTAETYYKAGDSNSGRYRFAIQREGEAQEVLFDVTDWTHHPSIPPAPAENWNPQKLYMSKGDDVDWIRSKGGAAQLYFDDWEVWSAIPSGSPPPSPPPPPTDSDADGLPDSWEIGFFGNLNQDGFGDPDGDGYSNFEEYQASSDPTDASSFPGAGGGTGPSGNGSEGTEGCGLTGLETLAVLAGLARRRRFRRGTGR